MFVQQKYIVYRRKDAAYVYFRITMIQLPGFSLLTTSKVASGQVSLKTWGISGVL
ncbi:MAG: hypothetical protein LBD89_01050 [Tannerellaceae bacterium]|jgi:hypothetical protein|nr:hypothetical protein [Tannerellaceae bacterium]